MRRDVGLLRGAIRVNGVVHVHVLHAVVEISHDCGWSRKIGGIIDERGIRIALVWCKSSKSGVSSKLLELP